MTANPTESASDLQGHTPEQAARILTISERQLRREISTGKLVARKLGRRTVILHRDLVAFIEALPAATVPR